MKKSLLALVVLGATASAAQAASSVTMYGRADVGYTKVSGASLIQAGSGETRLGIKGQEDLGNGLAATFQMEGRFDLDTGAKTDKRSFFDRESTVGLKGSFGHVRFGRSLSAMENGLGFVDIGRRSADISPYFSSARHSNGMFYSYSNGAFTVGGDVTTKGGYNEGQGNPVNTVDGDTTQKSAYGAYGKYSANGLTVGLAYQADHAASSTGQKNEYGVGLSYAKGMFGGGVSYAAGKRTDLAKTRLIEAYLAVNPTANDTVAAVFAQKRAKASAVVVAKSTVYGLEYVHALSKRTSVYANAARVKNGVNNTHSNVFDIAMRHNF